MTTLAKIGQEKQRISERLARLNVERTRLGEQLNELETAERVLTRFGGKAVTTERQRRGRPARTAPAAAGEQKARGGQQAPTMSMKDAILKPCGRVAMGSPRMKYFTISRGNSG